MLSNKTTLIHESKTAALSSKFLSPDKLETKIDSKYNDITKSVMLVVGSTNPHKLSAVCSAFEKCHPLTATIASSKSVKSNVSDQPIGLAETQLGAINRMKSSAKEFTDISDQQFAIAVGLENGIVTGAELNKINPGMYSENH